MPFLSMSLTIYNLEIVKPRPALRISCKKLINEFRAQISDSSIKEIVISNGLFVQYFNTDLDSLE
jgi:hypothetical protein